jgi:hypothetical protein
MLLVDCIMPVSNDSFGVHSSSTDFDAPTRVETMMVHSCCCRLGLVLQHFRQLVNALLVDNKLDFLHHQQLRLLIGGLSW